MNRVVFQMALVRHGARVDFERRGPSAIFQLQSMTDVDVILLDLMLTQGVSGLEIYDQIRTLPAYAHIPVVAVSAMDPSVAIPQVRARGFDGFIAKPIDSEHFASQVAAAITGEHIWFVGERSID